MASTYTSELRIEKIATGEQDGSWGTTTNTQYDLWEAAISGTSTVAFASDGNDTLSTANGSDDEARHAAINLSGGATLTSTRNMVCPTVSKRYIVDNNTTGGQSVTFKTSGGSGITIANGKRAFLYCDGTDVVDAFDVISALTTANLTATGGTITGITDLVVADGGTGAGTFTDGGVLLGSGTSPFTAMAVLADSEFIVGNGSTDPVAESGATARTSMGVGTGDSPQFTGIELGHASDTTLARASAGDVNVEGNIVYRAGGTDVPVTDGGSGAGTFTDGGILLGSGTSAFTAMSVLADGAIVVGDGATDPVALAAFTSSTGTLKHESGGLEFDASAVGDGDFVVGTGAGTMGLESGATAIATMGAQTQGDVLDDLNTTGAVGADSEFLVGTGAGALAWEAAATALASIGGAASGANSDITSLASLSTPLTVAQGGVGVGTLTNGGVLLGSGTGAVTAMVVLADGEFIVGDGTTDPVAESGATVRTSLGLGTAAVENVNAMPAMTLAGTVTGGDQIITTVNLKDYGEVTVAKGNLGATPAFDVSAGNHQTGTADQAVTSSTFTNPTASDELSSFTLSLTNGGAAAFAWPASVDWEGGSAPSLTASGLDILCFMTYDGGTIWHGFLASADSK